MTPTQIANSFRSLDRQEKMILALVALHVADIGKAGIATHIRQAGLRDSGGYVISAANLFPSLERLQAAGALSGSHGALVCGKDWEWLAIQDALDCGTFEQMRLAILKLGTDSKHFGADQALSRLRLSMLAGEPWKEVWRWLGVCGKFPRASVGSPLIDLCGNPFRPQTVRHFHPEVQRWVALLFMEELERMPDTAADILAWACALAAEVPQADAAKWNLPADFHSGVAEGLLLCGRLAQADDVLAGHSSPRADFARATILLLRGRQAEAVGGFAAAMKSARKELGKRNAALPGMPGMPGPLCALALMRAGDSGLRSQGDACIEFALRDVSADYDKGPYLLLYHLRKAQRGALPGAATLGAACSGWPLSQTLHALALWWLGLPMPPATLKRLADERQRAERAGFHWVEAQTASVLGRCGDAASAARAQTLFSHYGLDDLAAWYPRQEQWQRQLSALIGLQAAAPVADSGAAVADRRMVWLLAFDAASGVGPVEPREQKRGKDGNWTKGRPVALKRLEQEDADLDYMSEHDRRVAACIRRASDYYGSFDYSMDTKAAAAALVGHPLVFWADAPDIRVELLAAEPALSVTESGGELRLSLEPDISGGAGILVTKESPTRLRVLEVKPEHQRIADIIGKALSVPLAAKEQVLQAISAVSSMVPVQSAIGGGAANVRQVEADPRLHIHLLPFGQGLKSQILVRPLPDGGPWCHPGVGAENLIAEVGGTPLQTRRALAAECEAERRFIDACPTLGKAEREHGEWLLEQPEDCLELLLEIQSFQAKDQDGGGIVLAWPEGQKFKVGARFGASQLRMSIKGERDWFAAGGELQVDEGRVLDLRQLLELLKHGHGRFLKLGENEFLALTEEFHRRLTELAALGELHGKGVRLHPLAAFALEDLANSADGSGTVAGGAAGNRAGGGLKADKLWKAHLARLREVETFRAPLPGTLRAELRDYQLAGFEWLARLAHWGVGACLADDMGLGKTVQALALLLHRAPQGPALVVAPTSVCMNWLAEAARFAPTLNVTLFGGTGRGRQETLADPQPFELVVTSYGLLQQEAEQFAAVQWHTIVLDEAQAIKNAQTKRSQAVMALRGNFRMAATGTPLENHLGELWNLFRFINPGLLGSLEQFNTRFANPIERGQSQAAQQTAQAKAEQAAARARLRRLIQPFILRRTKTQVLSELPSRTEILLPVELSQEEATLYQALRLSALEKLSSGGAANGGGKGGAGQQTIQILAEIMKLRRACCNPHLVAPELGLPSSKLAAFAELLEGLLENRHKVLVFSQFVDHLSLIRAHLDKNGIHYQYLDGATPMQERKNRVDAFQAGDGDVFLISLKAGGMGINLTAADYVIHMDPWWNPAVEDQASDRAHRMGQMRPVTIYRLVARNTIEETIVDLHKHKRDLADSLLEGSEMAAKLSADEMMAMLRQGLQ